MSRKSTLWAFTLTETAICIGVIGALFLLAGGTVLKMRQRAHDLQCACNLRQISAAMRMYYSDHMRLPDGDLARALAPYVKEPALFRCPCDDAFAGDSYSPYYVRRRKDRTGEYVVGCPRHGSGSSVAGLFGFSEVVVNTLMPVTVDGAGAAPGETFTSGTIQFADGSRAVIGDGLTVRLVQSFKQKDGVLYSLVRIEEGSAGDLECTVTPGSKFEVLTPAGVAVVEGTHFVVTVGVLDSKHVTNVAVQEGIVRFDPYYEQFSRRIFPDEQYASTGGAAGGSDTLDFTAPSVRITGPTPGGSYSTSSSGISLSGTASDNVGVDRVTWANDRGGSGTANGTDAWSTLLPLHLGANVITVRAHDAAGNTTTDTITVTWEPTSGPPTMTIAGPTTDATYTTDSATLAISGVTNEHATAVTWSNDRGGTGTCTISSQYIWAGSGIALQTGVNVITVEARDGAGQTATDTLTVTYTPPAGSDTVPPVVQITLPTDQPTYEHDLRRINLTGPVTDNVAVTEVTWHCSGTGESGACTVTDDNTWVQNTVRLDYGMNTITITAKDAAGNTATDTLQVNCITVAPPPFGDSVVSFNGTEYYRSVTKPNRAPNSEAVQVDFWLGTVKGTRQNRVGYESWNDFGEPKSDTFAPNDN
jgi:hypothetical protein